MGKRKQYPRTFRPDVTPILHNTVIAWVHVIDKHGNHVDCDWRELNKFEHKTAILYKDKMHIVRRAKSRFGDCLNYEVRLED